MTDKGVIKSILSDIEELNLDNVVKNLKAVDMVKDIKEDIKKLPETDVEDILEKLKGLGIK